jgi:hypothetical protein
MPRGRWRDVLCCWIPIIDGNVDAAIDRTTDSISQKNIQDDTRHA